MTIESRHGVKVALIPVWHPEMGSHARGKSTLCRTGLETTTSSDIYVEMFKTNHASYM